MDENLMLAISSGSQSNQCVESVDSHSMNNCTDKIVSVSCMYENVVICRWPDNRVYT